MIQAISTYIKGIAIFMVFMTYVEVIMPDKSYKQYISLVMGLILIFLVLSPIGNVIKHAGSFSDFNILNNSVMLSQKTIANEKTFYNDEQKKAILTTYKSELRNQMESFLAEYGTISMLGIDVSEGDDDFGTIQRIYIEMTPTKQKKREKLIHIKPVQVNPDKTAPQNDDSDERVNIIKNKISDFYNLSVDHIYIKIV